MPLASRAISCIPWIRKKPAGLAHKRLEDRYLAHIPRVVEADPGRWQIAALRTFQHGLSKRMVKPEQMGVASAVVQAFIQSPA